MAFQVLLILGIDNTLREKLSGILFGLWRTYLDDFKQNHGSTEIAYGQVNFGKSSDRKRFACVYAFYSAEMVFAEEIVKKKSPFLWGLINLPTFEKEQADLPEGVAEAIHTYFQYKALTGYHKNGIISKINWIA